MSETSPAGGVHAGWRWATVALAIALVVLAVGTWWTYELDRGGAMGGETDGAMAADAGGGKTDGMGGMPSTDVRLPPVPAYYDGEQIFFVHPAVSDGNIAGTLTEMMGGSPVLTEPSLADVSDEATADVYVFANGLDGPGPLGHQQDVFPSAPGDFDHRSLREIVLVTWDDASEARELTSAAEVEDAEADGAVSFERPGVIVNAPVLDWPGGGR
jgi:hypothetical protein